MHYNIIYQSKTKTAEADFVARIALKNLHLHPQILLNLVLIEADGHFVIDNNDGHAFLARLLNHLADTLWMLTQINLGVRDIFLVEKLLCSLAIRAGRGAINSNSVRSSCCVHNVYVN